MPNTLEDLRQRRREIVDRLLTIQHDLAESKRAWLAAKGGLTFLARSELEAEYASLRVARHRISIEIHDAEKAEKAGVTARPLEEWQEEDRDVLWWRFPIEEPPYCGHPNCDSWPGYHTHFTRLVVPSVGA
jgi:hypothetical protein